MAFRKNKKIEILRKVPLFTACTDRELGRIASLGDEIRIDAGKMLTREGAPGREFFVIAEGRAKATLRKRKLASFGRGDCFGEMALLDQGPRTATIVAETPMTLFVFEPRGFASMLDSTPPVARKILRALAERLRKAENAPTH